jgi:hypothetical protein
MLPNQLCNLPYTVWWHQDNYILLRYYNQCYKTLCCHWQWYNLSCTSFMTPIQVPIVTIPILSVISYWIVIVNEHNLSCTGFMTLRQMPSALTILCEKWTILRYYTQINKCCYQQWCNMSCTTFMTKSAHCDKTLLSASVFHNQISILFLYLLTRLKAYFEGLFFLWVGSLQARKYWTRLEELCNVKDACFLPMWKAASYYNWAVCVPLE